MLIAGNQIQWENVVHRDLENERIYILKLQKKRIMGIKILQDFKRQAKSQKYTLFPYYILIIFIFRKVNHHSVVHIEKIKDLMGIFSRALHQRGNWQSRKIRRWEFFFSKSSLFCLLCWGKKKMINWEMLMVTGQQWSDREWGAEWFSKGPARAR